MNNISSEERKILKPYNKCDKWGFVDENYDFVIDPVFDEVFPFTDGLAKVRLNNQWQLINKTGKVVIKLEYEDVAVKKLSEELLIIGPSVYTKTGQLIQDNVSIHKYKGSYFILVKGFYKRHSSYSKYGVIDKNGNTIIDINFDWIEIINQFGDRNDIIGFLVDKKGKKGFFGKDGKLILECIYNRIWVVFKADHYIFTLDDKKALYDIEGKEIASPHYSNIDVFDSRKNLFKVATNIFSNQDGFINKNLKLVIPPLYNDATDFKFGLSVVKVFDKSGVIDLKGNIVVPIKYDQVTILNNKCIRVKKSGKSGLLTIQGAQILPIAYTQIESYKKGIELSIYKNSEYLLEIWKDNWLKEQVGLYDPIERLFLINCEYTSFEYLGNGIFRLSSTLFYDRNMTEIPNNPSIKEVRDLVRRMKYFIKNFVDSSRYSEYEEYEEDERYIDPEDRWSYTSPEERQSNLFDDDDPYYAEPSDSDIAEGYFMEEEGITEATRTTIYSISNKKQFIFPYEDLRILNGSFLAYKIGFRWGIMNLNNSIVTDSIFDGIEKINDYVAKVLIGTMWQLFIFSSNKVKSKKYNSISKICDALLVNNGNKYGVLDKFGNDLITLKYDRIAKLDDCQYFICENNNLKGVISSSGNLLAECKYDKILGCYNGHLIYQMKSIGYGTINLYDKSERVIDFPEISYLGNDLIGVSVNGEWGVANIFSGVISDIKYDKIHRVFGPQFIEVSIGGNQGLISLDGGEIIPCNYQRIELIGKDRALAMEGYYPYRTKLYDLNFGQELLVINHQFVHVISESLIEVKEEGRYYLYDFDGNLVIAAFDHRTSDRDGFFILMREEISNREYALIDRAGKYIIEFGKPYISVGGDHIRVGEFRFDLIGDVIDFKTKRTEIKLVKYGGYILDIEVAHSFLEGLAKVTISPHSQKKGLIDEFGNIFLPERMHSILKASDAIFYEDTHGWHMIDENGNHCLLNLVEEVATQFNGDRDERLYKVRISDKWGVWDLKMREIVPIKYEYNMLLSNEFIKVSTGELEAVYSYQGDLIVPCQYEAIDIYGESIFIAHNKDQADLYDNAGVKLTSVNCQEIKRFGRNVFAVLTDSKWALINRFGELYTSFIYDDIVNLNERIYAVQRSGYWGILNNLGKMLVPCSFDYIEPVDFCELNKVYKFSNNGDLGLLNDMGEIILSPQFDNMQALKSGNIIVKRKWKYGLINRKQQLVVPAEYDSVKELDDNPNLIEVTRNYLKGLVNELGETLFEPQFNKIEVLGSGNLLVCKNNKSGLVNRYFKLSIPIEYDRIEDVAVGSNLIFIEADGLKGIFSIFGESILEPKYKKIEYCNNDLFRIWYGSTDMYYIDSNGKVLEDYYLE